MSLFSHQKAKNQRFIPVAVSDAKLPLPPSLTNKGENSIPFTKIVCARARLIIQFTPHQPPLGKGHRKPGSI